MSYLWERNRESSKALAKEGSQAEEEWEGQHLSAASEDAWGPARDKKRHTGGVALDLIFYNGFSCLSVFSGSV